MNIKDPFDIVPCPCLYLLIDPCRCTFLDLLFMSSVLACSSRS
ncbi:hypothetical protein MtrunA17_Chr5g0426811 [Medicago truncatula]|uniref:Uncharacterized protein n=1 Tax=Medicago truncatula TaxID=3880 RepID=A0A396HW50_MEDTR|nr:hypothetical protein MtrunA17_Chr5g0426811 [Medicago truncatula]